MVSRLEPYRDKLRGEDTILLGPHSFEACNYLVPEDRCDGSHVGVLDPTGGNTSAWLDRNHVDLIYEDESTLVDPTTRLALAALQRGVWRRVAPSDPGSAGWLLLERR